MGRLGFRFHCAFCEDDLDDQGYKLIAYHHTKLEVKGACSYQICTNCYPKIQCVLRQTLTKIRIAKLQETWGHVKQDTAVKI